MGYLSLSSHNIGSFQHFQHYYSNDICFQLLFAQRANEIIKDHKKKHSRKPMFLYLPFQNVHWPYQVPKKYERMYPNIKHRLRRIFSGTQMIIFVFRSCKYLTCLLFLQLNLFFFCILGMVTAMDDAVGMVVEELKTQGLFYNSIIVFSADVSNYDRAKIQP